MRLWKTSSWKFLRWFEWLGQSVLLCTPTIMLCFWYVLRLRLVFKLFITNRDSRSMFQKLIYGSLQILWFVQSFENHNKACLSWITAGYAILSIPFTMPSPDGIGCLDWSQNYTSGFPTMSEFCSNHTETPCENVIYQYQDQGSQHQSQDLPLNEPMHRSLSG